MEEALHVDTDSSYFLPGISLKIVSLPGIPGIISSTKHVGNPWQDVHKTHKINRELTIMMSLFC